MATHNQIVEWINAVSVVVLVAVTAYYALVTRKILAESEQARTAAEKQALSGERQASVAFATLHHLQQQVEELQGLGQLIVRTTVDSVVRSIEEWKTSRAVGHLARRRGYPSPPPSL
jgi:hypothetical protein